MLLNIKQEAFTVYDIYNLDEGFKYTNFISETISMEFVLFFLLLLILLIFSFKLLIKVKREQVFPVKRFKKFLIILVLFLLARVVTLFSLESYDETAWEKIMFPKYYYDNFINPKKSLSVIGLYEYTSRDFWLFLKERFSTYGTKEEIDEILSNNNAVYEENEKTGIFSGKNLIMIMMESIDNAVVNEEVMPTLSYMKKNGWSFTERYSASNSGGSTIATEFTSMTGLFYNNKDKKYVKNNYKYSLPNQFVSHGYYVSSVHENHGMYYDRDILHKSLGFQNSYFLYDILENPNYYDDSQIILNDEIYDAIIPKNSDDHFMTFIITMAAHGPYTNNSVCYDYDSNMTEKECLEYLAGKTDDLLKVLLSRLEEDGLLDDTVIILYTDHQAYSYNYPDNYLNSLKKIDNNYNIKSIPFIIYSNGISSEVYDDILVNDIDLLPTILNLFGIEYDPNYYLGTDLFSDLHKNLVMFNDYSWYDGEIYSAEASSFKDVDYFEEISNYVEDKVNLSRIIISTDYYNYLFN